MNKEQHQAQKIKEPWPTKDAMIQVYEMKLWGNNNTDFYSGDGSHLSEIVHPYVDVLRSFLTSFKEPLTICDLGCGDFNVGKELVQYTKNYIAVDIVPSLIGHNKEKFKMERLKFLCMDIAVDELPIGDCAILRQVLQHLSNREVRRIAHKLSSFKYVIVTEHVPEGNFVANKDIISGQGIRLKKQSGVNLLASPFNLNIKDEKKLLSVVLPDQKGLIITKLYRIF
ncbi:class I SAM-dependent methyltransferase [Aquimarina sp. M1]